AFKVGAGDAVADDARHAFGVEARDDVLTYTTEPLAEDLIVVGRVALDVWVTSSAPTTDFTAKLVHVDTEGVPRIVCDGIARTHLEGGDAPEKVRIELRGTGQRFPKGHRLRLEVSSSNFPQYDRALNGDPSGQTVAHQTVFHGGEHASRLSFHSLSPAELEKRSCELLDVRATGLLGASLGTRVATATKSQWNEQQRRLFNYLSEQFGQPKGLFGRAVGLVLLNMNREINRWTVDQIDVQPDDRTLEIGFGPGYALREVSQHIRGGLATGIDHSDLMYETANRRNAAAIREGRVKLIHSPFDDVDIEEGSIDKVYAVNSIQIWPKPVESMKKLRKVLKPGGLIALTLRPSWVRTEQQVRSLGLERIRQLRAAGFTDARLEIKQTPGVVTFCALATNGRA
ncbi:MAG: CocE/NonD family hydrolase, partial [Acidobacteriota bacterium]